MTMKTKLTLAQFRGKPAVAGVVHIAEPAVARIGEYALHASTTQWWWDSKFGKMRRQKVAPGHFVLYAVAREGDGAREVGHGMDLFKDELVKRVEGHGPDGLDEYFKLTPVRALV